MPYPLPPEFPALPGDIFVYPVPAPELGYRLATVTDVAPDGRIAGWQDVWGGDHLDLPSPRWVVPRTRIEQLLGRAIPAEDILFLVMLSGRFDTVDAVRAYVLNYWN